MGTLCNTTSAIMIQFQKQQLKRLLRVIFFSKLLVHITLETNVIIRVKLNILFPFRLVRNKISVFPSKIA